MRSRKALKNIMFSLLSAFLSFVLMLINRKVIVMYLGTEMLGYESLFANVFSILSLSEMGAATVIAYQLYRSIANKDTKETNALVCMYKYLYRIIGGVVALFGIILFFFLQYIITGYSASWDFVQKIYLIQLAATVLSYFMTYKRMLFVSNQQEYIIIKVDILLNFVTQIIKIAVIMFWQNYIFYLIVSLSKTIVVNIIIQIKAQKIFPEYKDVKIGIEDFKKRNIFKDMFNFIGQKIASSIYYNTDNILISMLLGVSFVGLYSNYYTIKTQVFRLTTKIFNPIQATIGNYINDMEKENGKGIELFNVLDIISYSFALVFSCCLYNLFQPFIRFWYGEQYLLNNSIVILIVINAYIETLREIPYYFRSAFGQYEVDRKYVTCGAIANIVLTIVLGKLIGLEGVLIGTVVGMFFLWCGVIQFLFKVYFKVSACIYYIKHIKLSFLSIIVIFVTSFICRYFPVSIIGLIFRGIVSSVIPVAFTLIVFFKTDEFRKLINYGRQLMYKK